MRPAAPKISPVWLLLLAVMAADAVWIAASDFSLDWPGTLKVSLLPLILACITLFYRYVRRDDRIWRLTESFLQWAVFTPAMVMLSYLLLSIPMPLLDAQLIAVDHALGFHWLAHIHWLAAHAWLNGPLRFAYFSMVPQVALLWIVFSARSQFTEMQQFMLSVMLSAVVCCLIAAALPAMGGYVYYNIHPRSLGLNPAAARVHEAPLLALRSGRLRHLVLYQCKGLLTFPSFHTSLGVLLAWAARRQPGLRWAFLGLNALMIFSVFSQGGHYLVDVLAGAAVAVAAIAVSRKVC